MSSVLSEETFDDGSSFITSTTTSAQSSAMSSYEIVSQQMKDLALFQQSACDRFIEDSISRHNLTQETTISRSEFEKVLRELEEERLAHSTTKARLIEVEDKLEFSLGEIEILQGQLEREKAQYEKAFDILKDKTQKEIRERTELVSQCSVLSKTASQQRSTLSSKEEQLKEMDKKLKKQKEQYEKQVIELNLEKQQELFANKVIRDSENKKPKRTILKARNS